jgi:hypothetical protein
MKVYQTSPPKHRVTLNGVEVRDFIWADDQAGIIKVFARYQFGGAVFMNGQFITVECPGTVTIEPITWQSQHYSVTSAAAGL